MALWEYLGSWSGVTKWLYHLNWDANDSSGNWNNWTPTNITWVWWKLGSGAASFNGTSSYITVPSTLSSLTTSWTYSFFLTATSNASAIYSRWVSSSSQRNIHIYITFWGKISVDVPYIKAWIVTSNTTINDWTIRHIVITKSSNIWSIYINWILDNSVTDNITQESNTSASYIWKDATTSSQYLNWKIDEFIIENRAWTATEAQKYYTYSSWKFGIQ